MNKRTTPGLHLLLPLGLSLVFGLVIVTSLNRLALHKTSMNNQTRMYSAQEAVSILRSENGSMYAPFGDPLGDHLKGKLLMAVNLPENLIELPFAERKALFIALILPHLNLENERVLSKRRELERLWKKKQRFERLTFRERRWLKKLSLSYGLQKVDFTKLRRRVDIVPVSLGLAQAILETGWGTSRFAREGNALFGIHYLNSAPGEYMLSISGTSKVVAYSSLDDSVQAYYSLLNTADAYDDFRSARFLLRNEQRDLSSVLLAGKLSSYSELGNQYSERLQRIIKNHDLERFDQTLVWSAAQVDRIHFIRSGSS